MKNSSITKLAVNQPQANNLEYVRQVSYISSFGAGTNNKAVIAINTELPDANWQTNQYIVEFEQIGNAKAKYGYKLLVNLYSDLTRLKGRGFSRSILTYMHKFNLAFQKCATVSHILSWNHYINYSNVKNNGNQDSNYLSIR